MIAKKCMGLLLALAFTYSAMWAQAGLSYLPADATFVVHVNPENLNEKVNLKGFQQLEVFNSLLDQIPMMVPPEQGEKMQDLLTNPGNYGINAMKSFYVVGSMKEEGNFFGLLFELSDVAAFRSVIDELLVQTMEDGNIEQKSGLNQVKMAFDRILSWNNNMAFLGSGSLNAPTNWWEEGEMDQELRDQQLTTAIEEYSNNILNKGFSKSMANNPRFKEVEAAGQDIHFWMDYNALLSNNPAMAAGMADMGQMAAMYEMMAGMYKDTELSVGLNFDAGKLVMNSRMFADEKMMDWLGDAYKHKFNKDLLKYINGSNILGYMAIGLDMEETFEGMADVLFPYLEQDPSYGKMFTAIMGALDVVIDQESLYELLEGDMVLAVTGIQEHEKLITTYEYDENFNATPIERVEIEKIPELSFLAPFGNRKNIEKLLNLAVQMNGLTKEGNYYTIASEELGMQFFLALNEDDILIVSNDSELVGKKLNSGFEKNNQLPKDQAKMLQKNTQTIYWSVPNTLKTLSELSDTEENPLLKYLSMEDAQVEKVLITTSNKIKESVNTEMVFHMKNKEKNALEQIMNLLNVISMEMTGGTKM